MLGHLSDHWRPLKQSVKAGGYLGVRLHFAGKSYDRLVHRLILEAFVGPCPPGLECRHLDGDPTNNRASNLAWATHLTNIRDKARHGTKIQGSMVKNSVARESDARTVKRLLPLGYNCNVLAFALGLPLNVIHSISAGRNWRHVTVEEPA